MQLLTSGLGLLPAALLLPAAGELLRGESCNGLADPVGVVREALDNVPARDDAHQLVAVCHGEPVHVALEHLFHRTADFLAGLHGEGILAHCILRAGGKYPVHILAVCLVVPPLQPRVQNRDPQDVGLRDDPHEPPALVHHGRARHPLVEECVSHLRQGHFRPHGDDVLRHVLINGRGQRHRHPARAHVLPRVVALLTSCRAHHGRKGGG
mmetsp:Transcript_79/g.162  ORF Transcript_79/g.162 Transcript_79/m.162 type:complete len:210 (+) Transcript_79:144-773(+)